MTGLVVTSHGSNASPRPGSWSYGDAARTGASHMPGGTLVRLLALLAGY
ncbi:MAG: hypothetical protein ACYCPF_01480 [Streptosporangiaceae bacterium]